ncbi:MAG: hypothetical protein WD225_03910 [Ilumatobacteraceae bacterium]
MNAPTGSWDWTAIRAGAALSLLGAVPMFAAASWASGERDAAGLAALLSFGALLAFMAGAACAAWLQQVRLPLGHGIVTAVITYLLLQVVVTVYRLVVGSTVNLFNVMFFLTLASLAGLVGGGVGSRMRRLGFVPSHERRLDADALRGHGTDPTGTNGSSGGEEQP